MTDAEDIWLGDLLRREADAKILMSFLAARGSERAKATPPTGYVLNLDASWGQGKTYFLTRLRRSLEREGYLATYVNGWADDSSEEPLVSVISAIEKVVSPYLKKKSAAQKAWDAARRSGGQMLLAAGKGAIKRVITKNLGDGVEEIIEIVGQDKTFELLKSSDEEGEGVAEDVANSVEAVLDKALEAAVKTHDDRHRSVENFRASVSQVLKAIEVGGKKAPLFVLIDELDRCRPTYAISMLEQIKHIFDIPGLVFVIATDSDQLSHSINAVYGAGFDSKRYLRRFFERRFTFEEPSIDAFSEYLFKSRGVDTSQLSTPFNLPPHQIMSGAAGYFDLSLRDVEQCFEYLQTFITLWPHKAKIQLIVALPTIILQHLGRSEDADDFILRGHPLSGVDHKWEVQMPQTDHFGRRVGQRTVRINQLAQSLVGTSVNPLNLIVQGEYSEDVEARWVQSQFADEFQAIHNNQYQVGAPPTSVIRSYASLARSFGRISE